MDRQTSLTRWWSRRPGASTDAQSTTDVRLTAPQSTAVSPTSTPSSATGSRTRQRKTTGKHRTTWSIRAKILTLLLLPVVPLLALWMITTGTTLGPALNLFTSVTNLESAGQPATALVDQLQAERRLAMSWAGGDHRSATRASLVAQRAKTDAAIDTLKRDTSTKTFHRAESDLTRGYLGVLDDGLVSLPAQRDRIDNGAKPDAVMSYYNNVIDDAFGLYGSIVGIDDHNLARQANTVAGLIQAREMFSREDAIVAGAVAARRLTADDYATLVSTIGTERYLYQQATRFLPAADQTTYQSILSSATFTRLRGDEDLLSQRAPIKSRLPAGFSANAWRADFDAIKGQLKQLESSAADRVLAATKPAGSRIVTRLAIAGGVGLLVLVVLILVAIRIARSIIRRVEGLLGCAGPG